MLMHVTYTSDVPLGELRHLSAELGADFGIEIDETSRFYKGGIPPSWIRIFADADVWTKFFGAYVALYVAEIVKEAGKDTWKNRKAVVAAAGGALDRIRQYASALANMRSRLAPQTRIEIALPFPDEYDGTILELVADEANVFAFQLAVFVNYLPAINELIRKEGLSSATVATGIQLSLLADLSLTARWQDASLSWQTRTLTLDIDQT